MTDQYKTLNPATLPRGTRGIFKIVVGPLRSGVDDIAFLAARIRGLPLEIMQGNPTVDVQIQDGDNEEFLNSLRAVVDYNWSEEEGDYGEKIGYGDIEPGDERHIYTHLIRLREYLETIDQEKL